MGNSTSSEITYENNNIVTSNTTLNQLNEKLNETVSNTIISAAQACSTSTISKQTFDISAMDVTDDVNIGGITQSAKVNVNLACVDKDAVVTDAIASMMEYVNGTVVSGLSSDMIQKLDANAASTLSQGALSIPPIANNTNTSVSQKTKNLITNNSTTNINNVVKNSFVNNFSDNTIQNCISNVLASQDINLKFGKIGKSLNVKGIDQTQIAESIVKCEKLHDATNKSLNAITSALGITVVSDTKSKASTESKLTATSKSESKGLFDIFGEFAQYIPYMVVGLVVVAIIGGIGGIIYWRMQKKNQEQQQQMDPSSYLPKAPLGADDDASDLEKTQMGIPVEGMGGGYKNNLVGVPNLLQKLLLLNKK